MPPWKGYPINSCMLLVLTMLSYMFHSSALINYTETDMPRWKGYFFASLFFLQALIYSFFFHQLFHIAMTLGMRIKAALIAAVYKKVRHFITLQ